MNTLNRKWANVPGVKYPETERVKTTRRKHPDTPTVPPKGYVTARELSDQYNLKAPQVTKLLSGLPFIYLKNCAKCWKLTSAEAILKEHEPEQKPDGYLTIREISELLGLKLESARQLLNNKSLPYKVVKCHHSYRVYQLELIEKLKNERQEIAENAKKSNF